MKPYVGNVSIYVNDQDRSKKFWMENFGWECTMDADMGGGQRWLTVGPSGDQTEIVLVQGYGDWSADKVGVRTGVIIECDNVAEKAKALKANGVRFTSEPELQPWGGWAVFKDSEGNEFGLHNDPRDN